MRIDFCKGHGDVYLDVYFPKNRKGRGPIPAALICPGGGYFTVGTTEGRPVADKFNDAGYAAFILHYTVGEEAERFGAGGFFDFAPAVDLYNAMLFLHQNAKEYDIDAARIILAGFSAGGHLCAAWCFSGAYRDPALLPFALVLTYPMGGGSDSSRKSMPQPDFDIACMPYAQDPSIKKLPVFLWHAKDDAMVPFDASLRLSERLAAEFIPHEFLVNEHGVHARPFYDPSWFDKMIAWLAALEK